MTHKVLIFLITHLRPLLGPSGCCKFELSCTDYAIMQLTDQTLCVALWLIAKRLLLCMPLVYTLYK